MPSKFSQVRNWLLFLGIIFLSGVYFFYAGGLVGATYEFNWQKLVKNNGLWTQLASTMNSETSDIKLADFNSSGVYSGCGDDGWSTTSEVEDVQMISDGNNGAFVVWVNVDPTGNKDIYGQHINALGQALWGDDGRRLVADNIFPSFPLKNNQYRPRVAPDGSGGFFVGWLDANTNVAVDFYVCRFSASGIKQETWSSPVKLSGTNSTLKIEVISSGGMEAFDSGQAVFLYTDKIGSTYYLRVVKVGADGTLSWNIVPINTETTLYEEFQGVPDGLGGVFFGWVVNRGLGNDIYLKRLNNSGQVVNSGKWTSGGLRLSGGNDDTSLQLVDISSTNDVVAVWKNTAGATSHIYGQKITSTGNKQWGPSSVKISVNPGTKNTNPHAIPDGLGGVVVEWIDSSTSTVFSERVDSSGNILWMPTVGRALNNGTLLTGGSAALENSRLWKPAVSVWEDSRNDSTSGDLYGQIIDLQGNVRWICNGQAICTDSNRQSNPQAIDISPGGVRKTLLIWQEQSLSGFKGIATKIIDNDLSSCANPLAPHIGYRNQPETDIVKPQELLGYNNTYEMTDYAVLTAFNDGLPCCNYNKIFWQIASNSGFSNLKQSAVFDLPAEQNISYDFTPDWSKLSQNTTYYARTMISLCGNSSDWSETLRFKYTKLCDAPTAIDIGIDQGGSISWNPNPVVTDVSVDSPPPLTSREVGSVTCHLQNIIWTFYNNLQCTSWLGNFSGVETFELNTLTPSLDYNSNYCAVVSYQYQEYGGKTVFSEGLKFSTGAEPTVFNWLKTQNNDIYSGGLINGGTDQSKVSEKSANSTVESSGSVNNFSTDCPAYGAAGCVFQYYLTHDYPTVQFETLNYNGELFTLDVDGLLNGYYGDITEVNDLNDLPGDWQEATETPVFVCGAGCDASNLINSGFNTLLNSYGARTILIIGHDLDIKTDINFVSTGVSLKNELGSVAWIVIPDANDNGGNITIAPEVREITGAFFAAGNINTCGGTGNCESQLKIKGSLSAQSIQLNRSGGSKTEGAEQIIYDTRLILNPPPGLRQVDQTLPTWE